MGRPRSVNYGEVIKAIRNGSKPAQAAKEFKISRARVNQILKEHAPELLTEQAFAKRAETKQRAEMRKATVKALKKHGGLQAKAAIDLGITPSGLHARMRRLGIPTNSQNP
jgi:transcriptional regulator with GAF, ATPase, and Fis domain